MQDKQKRSALLASTPLADITSRHQQLTPTALPSPAKQLSSRAGPTPSAPVAPAVTAQEDVEEQCLSAGRWLRGLAEECCENVFSPARLQPDDIGDASQVGSGMQGICIDLHCFTLYDLKCLLEEAGCQNQAA